MNIKITGKDLKATEAIKEYIEKKCERLQKYTEEELEVKATIKTEGNTQVAEISTNINGNIYRAVSEQKDLYASIDKDIDILVNNAAIDLSNLFHLKTADEFRRTLDVNVVGAFNCACRVRKHMLEQEYGKIINISSTNGINTYYPMCIDYDASKAALISLTHNLAIEFAPYATVNAIAPGLINTESEVADYDDEFMQMELDKILVRRIGEASEVAHLVKFLISDEASYINNSIIRIDGGQYSSN